MLRRLALRVNGCVELGRLQAEFPSVELGVAARGDTLPPGIEMIRALDWWAASALELDCRLEGHHGDGGPEEVAVLAASAEEGELLALQVLTRYQHRLGRRNARSRCSLFDQVLRRHAHLHDLAERFVRADFIHGLDTWQWLLRLDPTAGLAVQMAALFHDVERPIVEPFSRSEPAGPSYQLLKDAHARASARLARMWLASLDIEPHLLRNVERLIEGHERPCSDDEEQALLNQADALSFISRGIDVYPPRLLSWRLRRAAGQLRADGWARLSMIRSTPQVRRALAACLPRELARAALPAAAVR